MVVGGEERPRHVECTVCSGLRDQEWATEKWGWEDRSTRLPSAAFQLRVVRDLRPGSFRKLELQQCPACLTYYLYKTDYEYLAGGSEDEECLMRLSDAQAAEYLKP